jgi:hypothetical protein
MERRTPALADLLQTERIFSVATKRHLRPNEWPKDFRTLYVVCDGDPIEYRLQDYEYDKGVATLSPDPEACGWETDDACGGYGLPLYVARAIADQFNGSFNAW